MTDMAVREEDAARLRDNMSEIDEIWALLDKAETLSLALVPAPAGAVFADLVQAFRLEIGAVRESAESIIETLERE